MIKKFIFCIVLGVIFSATSAWAAGIGVYGTGGVAFSSWYYHGTSSGNTTDYFYGGGLIIDSNVAKNTIFGYRFTAGYEQYVCKDPDSGSTGDPVHRFSMAHTFGFGVARTESIRFWIGPRFGFHYMYLNEGIRDIDGIGFDMLLALGINFNIGPTVTLFFDMGFGYMGNYNLNVAEIGHAFGLDGKVGIMFRVNDTYASVDKPNIQIQ